MNIEVLRGAVGHLLPGARFNSDRTRLFMPTASGLACYRGTMDENGQWQGTLAGVAVDEEAAERFLEGSIVDLRQDG